MAEGVRRAITIRSGPVDKRLIKELPGLKLSVAGSVMAGLAATAAVVAQALALAHLLAGTGATRAKAALRARLAAAALGGRGGAEPDGVGRSRGPGDVATVAGRGLDALDAVPDETHIFATSLANNLRLARPSASDAECLSSLAKAGLSEWAEALPNGLATLLGTGGRQVSAGERQRIGVARVLLAGSPLMLLDEPTAHLDPAASAFVLTELLGAAGDRSVVVVSHDPSLADYVDTIVTVDAGRVAKVDRGKRSLDQAGVPHARRTIPGQRRADEAFAIMARHLLQGSRCLRFPMGEAYIRV